MFDTAGPKLDKVAKNYTGPFLTGTVNFVGKGVPGSGWLWSHVKSDSWAIEGLQILGGIALVIFFGFQGYSLKGQLIDLAGAHGLLAAAGVWLVTENIVAYIVAFAAVALVGGFIIDSIERAKQQGIGLVLSVLGAWALHSRIDNLAHGARISGVGRSGWNDPGGDPLHRMGVPGDYLAPLSGLR